MTTQEIILSIEETIVSSSPLGLQIGTLIARLEFATRHAEAYGTALKSQYESIGNDYLAENISKSLVSFRQVTA